MNVIINGDPRRLEGAPSVAELLKTLGYENPFVAVAVNRTCVRRAEFSSTPVKDGDQVEILAPMAGG